MVTPKHKSTGLKKELAQSQQDLAHKGLLKILMAASKFF